MRNLIRTGLLTLTAVVFAAGAAGAAVLVQEGFNYPDGTALSDLSAWTDHSGSGPIEVLSGEAIIKHAVNFEDVHTHFSSGPRDTLATTYVCMDVTFPSGFSTATPEYFTHLMEAEGFNYHARVWADVPQAGGDVGLAISSGSSDRGYTAVDLNFDQQYQIVVRFDGTTGIATLWVDPANEGDTSVNSTGTNTGTSSARIALRQDSSIPGLEVHVDNIVVATSFAEACPAPTPSASQAGLLVMSLLMLGGGTVFMLRRRSNGTFAA